MKPYYESGGITIYHGDCREILPSLGQGETCITDPPYGLTQNKRGGSGEASLNLNSPAGRSRVTTGGGFMGQEWDAAVPGPEFWRIVIAALKPGALCLAFGGTRTWHRLACAIEDGGFEIRDTLVWLYGSGFPKSLDISKAIDKAAGAERKVIGKRQFADGTFARDTAIMGQHGILRPAAGNPLMTAPSTDAAKQWNGWGTSLKPSWEPIILAMKSLDGTFSENALKHGVAGLNIDGARVQGPKGDGHWSGEDGSDKRSKPGYEGGFSTGGEKHPQGRFPANLLLDEEAARMLDEQSGVLKSGTLMAGTARSNLGGYTGPLPKIVQNTFAYGDEGGASRFFYTAKASGSERNDGYDVRNDHPTVKPLDLMRYLCKLTATPTGGTILDPFMGSGTTLIAARDMGRRAIGIETEEKYCEIAVKRLAQGALFGA